MSHTRQAAHKLMLIEAEIERFGSSRVPKLRFEQSLEDVFRKDYSERRARWQFWLGVAALICFNGFLLGDWFIIRDHFATAVAIRLGVVTPMAIALLYVVRANLSRWSRELAVCGLGFIGCVSTLYLAFSDGHTFALQAEPTVFIILVLLSGLFRVEFRYCVIATLGCLLANTVYLMSLMDVPYVDRLSTALPVMAAAFFMLVANWISWRQLRTSYLLQLRGEQQSALLTQSNLELRQISERDELTGVGSRYAYERVYKGYFEDAIEAFSPISVVMVDVDHFKMVNDEHGHAYGDRVLQRVGSLIQQALRAEKDFAARYGGEEFIVLLPDTDMDAAEKVADRIRTLVQVAGSPGLGRDAGIPQRFTTVSCGVATMLPDQPEEPGDVVNAADRALYRAKALGRNRVCRAEDIVPA
ncbi:MAG: GGDEF domain-containing protein [Acidobacteria bacterium]|nr:GGDEF domain-containing protein [Acidobacteriota bacterium]